ncbi:MAG TPA: hypothetical protein VF160_02030 [Candidatus Dormibacteraeota bacterium]
MNDPRRDILAAVARGELAPEEGARRLEELSALPPGPAAPALPPPIIEARPVATDTAIQRVRVSRALGTAEIVGDPSVQGAVADGPHVAQREGDTLVIRNADFEAEDDEEGTTFRFRRGGIHVRAGSRTRVSIGGDPNPIRVRMNPDLDLEVDGSAGSIRIRDVHGAIRASAQAGSLHIDGFRGPLDLSVQAGSLRGSGTLTAGVSRINCDAGSVHLDLKKGSSVRIKARSTLGKVSLGDSDTISVGSNPRELVIGGGEASLEIDATMGSVRISADQ